MSIPALITVNGVEWPEPSDYKANTATLVDSARNAEGKVIGSVVRHGVSKIEVSWKFLTAKQWANIIGPFDTNFYSTVRFFDQTSADYVTKQMYVSDRAAGMFRRDARTGEVLGWVEPKLSLIEV
jgi:hypothetical protein